MDPFNATTFIGFLNIIIGSYALTMGILSIIFGCFDERKAQPIDNTVRTVSPPQVNRI